jgi:rare lipoprotein A
MRNLFRALLIVAISGIVPVAPQAFAHWECMGPAFACQGAAPVKSSYQRGWQNDAPKRRYTKHQQAAHKYAAYDGQRRPVRKHRVAGNAKAHSAGRHVAKAATTTRLAKVKVVTPTIKAAETVEAPKVVAPAAAIEAPKVVVQVAPKVEALKTVPVKTQSTVAVKTEVPSKDAQKAAAVKVEAPKVAEVKPEAKVEAPKIAEVKPQTKVEAPKVAEAKVEAKAEVKPDVKAEIKKDVAKLEASKPAATTAVESNYRVTSSQAGMASFYGTESGSQTASGQRFNPNAMTAAHRTLPFGTRVRVTNKRNGRSVVVTINDRGPFIRGRIIDLSTAAAGVIGMRSSGVAPVSVEVLARTS